NRQRPGRPGNGGDLRGDRHCRPYYLSVGAAAGARARHFGTRRARGSGRAAERAILERAARAHAPSWLLDPKILATAVQVGRSLGWQRAIPLALVAIMAAQWAREHRAQSQEPAE